MRIILPMAGHGKRFADAGYTVDKPFIDVNGKTLLRWSVDCIPASWEPTFVLRTDQSETDLDYQLSIPYRFPTYNTLSIPGSTRGAAMTVLAAAVALPPDEPVAVMNCDQYFEADLDAITAEAMARGWDGYILTFGHDRPWPGPAWSYALTDDWHQVIRVVEKPKTNIGPHATVGFYWWRQAGDLVWAICDMIAHHITVNGEFYLAPAYNSLLMGKSTDGNPAKIVKIVPVTNFVGLGTPEQVRAFEQAALVREP